MNWSATPERLVIIVFLALCAGWALGQWWRARDLRRNRGRLRREAIGILQDAERQKKAKLVDAEIQARETLIEERKKFEAYEGQVRSMIVEQERQLTERGQRVAERSKRLEAAEQELQLARKRIEAAEAAHRERELQIQALEARQRAELERIAGLSHAEAEKAMQAQVFESVQRRSERMAKQIIESTRNGAESAAREIVIQSIERLSRNIVSEQSICCLPLPTPEMKGRIIGREGRNVRAFEAITGVDVLLDEMPDHVVLSSHDPRRREVAKRALVALMQDGRIQPSRIELTVKDVERALEEEVVGRGRQAAIEAAVGTISDPVARALGLLFFRTSYSQNVFLHSIETARVAALIAAEIGLPEEQARKLRRAALLHDIGKALGDEYAPTHALAGAELLRQHSDDEDVVNAVAAHHNQVPDTSLLAPLVRAADTLSGGRPGARRDDVTEVIRRIEAMEQLAREYNGVTRAYAFQAGRELQVVVAHETISDEGAQLLAHQIAERVEREVKFPGSAIVTVIREVRAKATIERARSESF